MRQTRSIPWGSGRTRQLDIPRKNLSFLQVDYRKEEYSQRPTSLRQAFRATSGTKLPRKKPIN